MVDHGDFRIEEPTPMLTIEAIQEAVGRISNPISLDSMYQMSWDHGRGVDISVAIYWEDVMGGKPVNLHDMTADEINAYVDNVLAKEVEPDEDCRGLCAE